MPSHTFAAILILASTVCSARASFVTFFPPSASQCSNFTLNFIGDQISFPISVLLLPVSSSAPTVVQLPAIAFNPTSNLGTYTTLIPFAAGTQFIVVVRDAQGLGNGGVSTLYTVGGLNAAPCPLQPEGDKLAFSLLPSPPAQCEIQTINWTPLNPNSNGDNANDVSITGYVIGGLAFRMNFTEEGVSTRNSTMWRTSVPQGQDFMFFYERTDPATGIVRGETSVIQNVQPGPNSDCTEGGPSVTPAAVPPTISSGPTRTSTQTSASTLSSGLGPIGDTSNNDIKLQTPALIGILVGGICFTAILIALLYRFCFRNRRRWGLSRPEGDPHTAISSESRAALMNTNYNAPMRSFLPPVRTSGLGLDSFSSPYTTTAVPATKLPAQRDFAHSPNATKQRGRTLAKTQGRQGIVHSVGSWGNKGLLTESMIEPKGPVSVISEYSTLDSVLVLPSATAMPMLMSHGGSGPGRERAQNKGYYPRGDSGARSKSRDDENRSAARDHADVQVPDSQASEYSPTELSHIAPLHTPSAVGQTSFRNYYPAPVQPPSRTNPLIQRRLSAYEEDDNYHKGGVGRTRMGAPEFRPVPDGKSGVAL